MTKVTLPPIFQEIWGKVNKGRIAFRRFRKAIVLEVDPSPSYTRTTLQDKVRNLFKEAIEQWNKLTPEEKQQYDQIASKYNLTGYQYFIGQYISENYIPPGEITFPIEIRIVEQSGRDLTDYQVLLQVKNDPDFFNALGEDPTKIEIYAEDKTTQLPFYVEEYDPANQIARIWIKIPSIPANSGVKAYIAYNPARTTPLSDPNQVFDLYDDFEDGVIDTSLWNVKGNVKEENGTLKLIDLNTATLAQAYSSITFNKYVALEFLHRFIYTNRDATAGFRSPSGVSEADGAFINLGENGFTFDTKNEGTTTSTNIGTPHTDFKQIRIVWLPTKAQCYIDGELKATNTSNIPDEPIPVRFAAFGNGTNAGQEIDYVRVRKYTDPEPEVTYAVLTT